MEKTKGIDTKATPETKAVSTEVKEPRNFLAAFLLVVSFGGFGVNRLYTGDTTLGWVRFGLFVGGILLSPVIVGLPLLFAAQIWGWIDVFLVYHGNRTDADGIPMVQTLRDRKFAKILYILFILSIVATVLMFILGIIVVIVSGAAINNSQNN